MGRERVERIAKVLFIVVLYGAMFGCDNSNKLEPTLSSLWDKKLNGCGVNCHNANAADGSSEYGPDLSSKNNFYNNLVGKNVTQDYPGWTVSSATRNGDCDDVNFITPGDAGQSTVTASLIVTYSDNLIAQSLSGCTATSYSHHVALRVNLDNDQEVAGKLVQWINDGAQNN